MKKRNSPMKGRKISEEDRGDNAPKLGRPFIHEDAQRFVISVSVPPDMLSEIMSYYGTDKNGTAIRKLIEEKYESIKS